MTAKTSNNLMRHISLDAYSNLWEKILDMTPEYDPKVLRRYAPASKEVYGEVNPVLVNDFIKMLKLSSRDVLYDLGSGVGNVVMQAAAQTGCVAVGVEIRSELTDIAMALHRNYKALLKRVGFPCGEVKLVCGDITSSAIDISNATVVFLNNYCFPQYLEQSVLKKFKKSLKDGVRIITLKDFAPRFRPTSTRFLKSHCHMFRFPWTKCRSSADAVSWTDKSVEYFIYQVDRENLVRQEKLKENFKQGLRIESSDKKGNESESSDAEICVLIQCKAKFRGLAANNLLQILRESHALSKMIKPLGFNADDLEVLNQRAGEKLKEAGLNAELDRTVNEPDGVNSVWKKVSLVSVVPLTLPMFGIDPDEDFAQLVSRFEAWQEGDKQLTNEWSRGKHAPMPDIKDLLTIEAAAEIWKNEVDLPKRIAGDAKIIPFGDEEELMNWNDLSADFAKWKECVATPQANNTTLTECDKDKEAERPILGKRRNASYPLPPGWTRKSWPSGAYKRWRFTAPTGEKFPSLSSALEFISKRGKSKENASLPTKLKKRARSYDERRAVCTKKPRTSQAEEKLEDRSTNRRENMEFTNANFPLPGGWSRVKSGRHWIFIAPDNTRYRSLRQVLEVLKLNGLHDNSEGPGISVQLKPAEKLTQRAEGLDTPVKQRPAKKQKRRKKAQEKVKGKRSKGRSRKLKRGAGFVENPETEAKESQNSSNKEEPVETQDPPERTSSASSGLAEQEKSNDCGNSPGKDSLRKKKTRRNEIDKLRGWDQWREEEKQRKKEFLVVFRARRQLTCSDGKE